jgi:hypothetical protein
MRSIGGASFNGSGSTREPAINNSLALENDLTTVPFSKWTFPFYSGCNLLLFLKPASYSGYSLIQPPRTKNELPAVTG